MSSNSTLIDFIYGLNKNNIFLWLQDGTVRVFIPSDKILSDQEKSFIKEHKKKLIVILQQNEIYTKESARKILKYSSENWYPLSYSQERMWFLEKFEHGTNIYNIPRVYKLPEYVDRDILKKSINNIIVRHEILRTFIKTDSAGVGYQSIDNEFKGLDFRIIKVDSISTLHQIINNHVNRIFNLEQEYPVNIEFHHLVDNKTNANMWYMSVVFHHIATDGWSIELFTKELNHIYFADVKGSNSTLLDLPIQYKDYAAWQRNTHAPEQLGSQINYWQDKLNNYEVLYLPQMMARPENISYHGKNITFDLDLTTSNNLRSLAQNQGAGLYSILLTGYFILLKYLSNQNDLIIGTVIANRTSEQIEPLIGFFVNTLALRVKISSKEKLIDFIEQVKIDILNAKVNQDVPFEKLVDCLQVPKDTSRHPLFQIMFATYNFESENPDDNSAILEPYDGFNQDTTAKFDLTTTWDESRDQLRCNFNYNISLLNEEQINTYIDLYQQVLVMMKIEHLTNLTIENLIDNISSKNFAFHQILQYPKESTLFSLFEEQALLTPDALAVIDAKLQQEFTYKQLAADMLRVASYLYFTNKDSNSQLIAILSEKGYNHALTTLAIMKSGYAYLPLHHEWPINRVTDILEQGQVSIILVSKYCFEKYQLGLSLDKLYKIIVIEDLLETLRTTFNDNTQLPKIKSSDIAYVIFTSGSTGKPKGVTISHRGAINTIYAVNQRFAVNSTDSVLALSELSFDLSVFDIFGLLAVGGKIVFPDSECIKDPDHWNNLISKHDITIWNSVPQLAGILATETATITNSLRLFLLSGDWIPLKLPDSIRKQYAQAKIISLGGATEGSIWSIWFEINEVLPEWNSIPYGMAMPNQTMLILNDSNSNCLAGVIGDIYIGGEGVALNYWNDQAKTNNSFITSDQHGRIYKTGDLGRWNSKGYIEFIGRKDSQVKLNGYRIELDEISINLSKIIGISDAVSLFLEKNNQKFICSYYVGIKQDEEFLLNQLKKSLPEYMLPTALIHLGFMPLTSNGKLDKQQLPYPTVLSTQTNFTQPRNDIEERLCEIFAKILNKDKTKISIYDDFFKLGGDSISSIRLVSQVKKELALAITIKDIFLYRNVAKLHEFYLSNKKDNAANHEILAEQGVLTGDLELLPIQQWFFATRWENINYFNHAFLIKVPELDLDILQEAVNQLLQYHDILRIKYAIKPNGSSYEPYYSDTSPIILKYMNIAERNTANTVLEETLSFWQSDFDIINGPLCSFGYIKGYADNSARIHIAIHHLLTDTISWGNLTNDLKLIYQAISTQTIPQLTPKGTSYRQWVSLVQQYKEKNLLERKYWQKIVNDYNKTSSISPIMHYTQQLYYASNYLDERTTEKLLVEANESLHTEINDLLLVALAYTLADITHNRVNYITLEGHGREQISPDIDISNTCGWFTTMYPVRLEVNTASRLSANIKLIKEGLRTIPNKGVGYGALIGFETQQLPKITFNYLGQFNNQIDLDEWYITHENSGATISNSNIEPNVIAINAAVVNNKFEVYFKSRLDQTQTDFLASQYINHLKKIINILLSDNIEEYTMSDYHDFEPYTVITNCEQQEYSLFLFPPGVGGYECYMNNIVPELDFNLVLFNNFNYYLRKILSEKDLNNICFENLAETYIAHIKAIQPNGPYIFFGWSFGGVLAFEISKQLIQLGDKVTHLFMVDPYFKVNEISNKLSSNVNNTEVAGLLNYKYNSNKVEKLHDMKVTLFKATIEHIGEHSEFFNYYTKNEQYNSLEQIIPKDEIFLEPIQASHFSWIDNKTVVNQIAHTIKNCLGAINWNQ